MDFETKVEWTGSYPAKMDGQNGMTVTYSPPVELGGMKGPMTPEDAFVGAANMCFQIVFVSVSKGLGMTLTDYRCAAVGDLQTVDGAKKFVKITLRPEMRFAPGSNLANLEKAIDATKRRCLVTNSMALQVDVVPKVME
ncbi:MAG: OsmC family protein [Thermoplasmata archaeon]|jgi:organic hydroperoxide reductase OsmC/OhrA|nr:OsmC family protein [Thermoplasmata archaeon]